MEYSLNIEKLSKSYRIGHAQVFGYRTLRESIMEATGALLRSRGGTRPATAGGADGRTAGIHWALRDVSLKIEPGEVVGILGQNGAGKSTLLKILSRITEPTAGRAAVRGRIGSLLEVGTGFHPELSGRENIYLNGAILGMTRREIDRKFDEIVAFAEVEKFLDTPAKRYSSGMYMRLAFAVASHLESEILVVDEVLAVGDAAFQKKCLGKMSEVHQAGRTVLFVSHNMAAIKSLCTRAILLSRGELTRDGSVDDVVNAYLDAGRELSRNGLIPAETPRLCNGEALFRSVRLTDLAGEQQTQLYFGQRFRIFFTCDVLKDCEDMHFEMSISSLEGVHVTYSSTLDGGGDSRRLVRGRYAMEVEIDVVLLPRHYTIDLGVHHQNGTTADFVRRTLDFTVLRVAESGDDHYRWGTTRGHVRAPARWTWHPPTS